MNETITMSERMLLVRKSLNDVISDYCIKIENASFTALISVSAAAESLNIP
jgi:hypothetical protein